MWVLINDNNIVVRIYGSKRKDFNKAFREKKDGQAIWAATKDVKIGDKV